MQPTAAALHVVPCSPILRLGVKPGWLVGWLDAAHWSSGLILFPGIFHSISDSSVDLQISFEMQMNFESDQTSSKT
jgi:hypothetical protein